MEQFVLVPASHTLWNFHIKIWLVVKFSFWNLTRCKSCNSKSAFQIIFSVSRWIVIKVLPTSKKNLLEKDEGLVKKVFFRVWLVFVSRLVLSFWLLRPLWQLGSCLVWWLYHLPYQLICTNLCGVQKMVSLQRALNGKFFTKIWQSLLFHQHSQPLHDVMQKKSWLRFSSKFWISGFLKDNSQKQLLIFDVLCEDTWNSKAFVDIVGTPGRHRELSTLYIERDLCIKGILGETLSSKTRIWFPSNHPVLWRKSMRWVGLESKLVDWYRDATSVSHGHLLIDLLPRPDKRLRYCTKTGSSLLNLYIPECLKHLESLEDEHTKKL